MFHTTTNPLETKTFIVPRQDLASNDVGPVLCKLQAVTATPEQVRENFESIELVFAGYGECQAELWRLPEVRNYVRRLHEQYPPLLHVLSKDGPGLLVILMCLVPESMIPASAGIGNEIASIDSDRICSVVIELQAAAGNQVKDGFSQKQLRFMETQFNRFMQQVLQQHNSVK